MARWWGKARKAKGVEAVAERQGASMGPVHGTLPGQIEGSDGLRAVTLSVHDAGLTLADDDGDGGHGAAAQRVYPWAEVAHIWTANDMEVDPAVDDTVVTRWVHVQRLAFTDGTVVALRLTDPPVVTPKSVFVTGVIADHPPSTIWPLLERIRDHVTELHVAEAKATLAEGGRVEFGPLTATADGLLHDGTAVPWEDITSLRYSYVPVSMFEDDLGSRLRMEFRDRNAGQYGWPYQWLRIPALEVPDIEVLVRLATEGRT
ncbi:hypothetical protein ACFWVC_21900 [Streptomyces sp. NPDC058691]|uniref:hypothetical protein n=1 Tax=Streptomyces sp. NPDC058691 TaxID=3346601 RepID=UPI00365EB63A